MGKENGRNIIKDFSERAISLRSGLIYGLLTLLIVVALTGGMTSAWFTSGANTENTFTAGTLDIEIEGPVIIETESFNRGGYIESNYKIKNPGSKTIYVRASFSGYWKRGFHKNTATATVIYNGQTISVSDNAHYSFANYNPSLEPEFQQEATFGFYDDYKTPWVLLPPVISKSSGDSLLTGFVNGSTAEGIGADLAVLNNDLVVMTSYPEPCNGPIVAPVSGNEVKLLITQPPDPDPKKLDWPEGCTNLYTYKINADQKQINVGVPYQDAATGFSATIYKKDINGKAYFSFLTNYPVYYVFAKGGPNEGNFYRYYPLYPSGIYSDCGLSQPGGDWSHITFYYCKPPANPSLDLKKFVSLDGGATWEDANTAPGASVNPPIAPQFKFVVTNTGNVPLANIEVEDDYFGPIGVITSLEPGALWEVFITDNNWDQQLSTENITFELCEGQNNWVKHGDYFYYKLPIYSNTEINLCVKILLDSESGAIYDGAKFVLYSYFEAVQTTNGLVIINWGLDPTQLN